MSVPTVVLTCPAKLNLALAVGTPDPQDKRGLHPIASWMVALGFGDVLNIKRLETANQDARESFFSLRYATEAPVAQEIDWPLESDLTVRAHRWLEHRFQRSLPVHVQLDKRIPNGAGLGGGSSNAAGMVVGLERLFDLDLGEDMLAELAETLGSDVYFALAAMRGRPSSLVTGTGDSLEPVAVRPKLHVVLVLPDFRCPTAPVYAAWDMLHAAEDSRASTWRADAIAGLTQTRLRPDSPLFNDLEIAATQVEPRLATLLEKLRDDLKLPAHVTGSGSACFVLETSAEQARVTAQQIRAATGVATVATHTPSVL
jgi:4-diphosphocytidyl-2-C-methyl-D-erythritol kinase